MITADTIYGFSNSLLIERYDSPKPTPQFHYELWKYCCSDAPRVAIGAPRGHAKSTAVTHAYVLASVLFREADFVIIVSDTETQASQFLNDLKVELYENDKLRQLFQVNGFEKDAEREIIVNIGFDHHRFRIIVRGAGGGSGSVRGFKWRNKRPNLIICDDIENDEAVLNEDRRAKFREWFFGALIPALSDDGKIRIVGTILHFDSLLERLMHRQIDDYKKYIVKDGLKETNTDPKHAWNCIKYKAHTDFDDFSEILWMEKFPESRLKSIRDDYIAQGYPEGYSQEYLNYPISEESAFFRHQDFIPMTIEDRKKHKTFYAAMDPAISEEDKRSYTSITVVGIDEEGIMYVVDQRRKRLDAKEIIDELFDVQLIWKPDEFIIEDGALKKSLGPFIKDEMYKRNIFINIHPMTPIKDKKSRARPVQGRMRQGAVRFDFEADWFPAFQEELLKFDRGEYNDQVDSFAWLGQLINEMVEAPSLKELEELEYQRELKETQSIELIGRSKVTGY